MAADPRFTDMAQRSFHFAEVFARMEQALQRKTTAEWMPLMEARDILCAPIADYDELKKTDQFAASGTAVDIAHPVAGNIRLPGFAIGDTKAQSRQHRPPPVLGEHSEAILQELLGLGFDKILSLRQAGVI